ncbi:MAG: glycoside hydrolase family 3 protein [Bacteroidales bacterium]|nr:glycoside hydrolase family 3 protein [Bacteroidales bacterium]MCL2738985.1 glycoside hydrolase family 3 protein [Bacteroidales bacterium]
MKRFKFFIMVLALTVGTVDAQAQKTKRQWVQSNLKTMTLREQIAQLFVIVCHPRQGEAHINKVLETIRQEQVGGIIWGTYTPTEYVHLLNKFQAQVRIPLMVSMDAEWGVSMRIDSVVRFPQQLTLGAIQDDSLIYDFGVEVARQCKELGIHINYAPVVDVNNNPRNPVINMRSFGENKYKVTEKAYAYMKGMQDEGILTTLKHFPGHGDTDRDSHDELPVILHDRYRLNDVELYPFRELIKRGATGVMVAHLLIPALSSEIASQSKEITTNLLQKELKFKGLVVTDALEMKGALHNRDTSKVALYSLMAGNDILEIPIDMKKSIDEIEKAVKSGLVSKRYIRKKCKKILEAKYDLGLHNGFTPINPTGILEKLNTEHTKSLRAKLSQKSLTLLSNNSVLPVNSSKVTYVEIGQGTAFKEQLEAFGVTDMVRVNSNDRREVLDSLSAHISGDRVIVVGCHNVPRGRFAMDYGIDSPIIDFLDRIGRTHKVVLVFFGNPYSLANLKDLECFSAVIAAYDNSDEAQIASANALFGKQGFYGKLPVTINDKYREDFGLIVLE